MLRIDKMKPGYVYILTNDAFREDWIKIGKSARSVDIRSKELDNTAVPLPFTVYATMRTVKYQEVEKLVHSMIDGFTNLRIRRNREFFNIPPAVALDLFRNIALTIDDAQITVRGVELPKACASEEATARRRPFRFSMIGIAAGETLTFEPTGAVVKVVDDKHVEFEGRRYTLSGFTQTHMPASQRFASGAYQGPKYFSYRGVGLLALRRQKESSEA